MAVTRHLWTMCWQQAYRRPMRGMVYCQAPVRVALLDSERIANPDCAVSGNGAPPSKDRRRRCTWC